MKRKLVLIISLIQLFNLPCLFAMQQGGISNRALAQVLQKSGDSGEIKDLHWEQKNKEEKNEQFWDAITYGKQDVVEDLIHDPDLYISGVMSLISAVNRGDAVIVKMLLEDRRRIDVNRAGEYGRTALISAIDRGDADIVKILLEEKTIDTTKNNKFGRSAQSWAKKLGSDAILKIFSEEDRQIGINKEVKVMSNSRNLEYNEGGQVKERSGETSGSIESEGQTEDQRNNQSLHHQLKDKKKSAMTGLLDLIMKPFRFAKKNSVSILPRLDGLRKYVFTSRIVKWVCAFFV